MADHERSSTKHQRSTHRGQLNRSEDRHLDSHKFENRSDRDDSYDYSHGSFRTAREERAMAPQQRYPQSDRGRHFQYDYGYHRYSEPEDRLSSVMKLKDHRWNSRDRPETMGSRSHERFNRVPVDDTFYGRESSNGLRNTNRNTTNERRRIRGPEKHDRKDEPEIGHEKRHQWDNEYHPKAHDNYHKEEEQERQEAKLSPAGYSSSDVTSLKARYKDRGDLDEQTEHHPYTADRRSERYQLRTSSSRGRPSSRGSSSRSLSSAFDTTDGSRERDTPKEGSSFGRRLSLLDRRRSPSPSPRRSESRHRGIIRSSSKSHSSVKKDSHKHSGKRKHRDRSGSPDDRKRRKRKEREREKDKEISRENRKKDEERRSVLTGKKIKLKVKKDKGDHERDANRKDLLQFLNSAFE